MALGHSRNCTCLTKIVGCCQRSEKEDLEAQMTTTARRRSEPQDWGSYLRYRILCTSGKHQILNKETKCSRALLRLFRTCGFRSDRPGVLRLS
jgi:hypothetical protein